MRLDQLTRRIVELDGGHRTFDFGTFQIHSAFQPIYEISRTSGALYGVEALARPMQGEKSIEPLTFFSKLEGWDRFIADWACLCVHLANAAAWQLGETRLFVNLNPHSCSYRDQMITGVEQYCDLIAEYGLRRDKVVFEITEGADCPRSDLLAVVEKLRALGFGIAIDDFGRGKSDLLRVIELRPDIVKVDAGWFRKMMENEASQQFAHSIIQKLHGLGVHLLFESVETPRELHWARDCAGSLIQGWLFGKATNMGEAASRKRVDMPADKHDRLRQRA